MIHLFNNLLIKLIQNFTFNLQDIIYKFSSIRIAHGVKKCLSGPTRQEVVHKLRLFSLGKRSEYVLEDDLITVDVGKVIPEVLEHWNIVQSQ